MQPVANECKSNLQASAELTYRLVSQVIGTKTLFPSAFQQQGHLESLHAAAKPQAPWDWATPSATRLPLHPEVQRNCQVTDYVEETVQKSLI